MQRERATLVQPLPEIVALQYLADRDVGGEAQQTGGAESVHPARVEVDNGLCRVQQFEDLLLIGFGVGADLFTRELRPGGALARRITNHSGEVADQKDRRVAQFLKRSQLADDYCVAQVNVRGSWIRSQFDSQGLTCLGRLFELYAQFLVTNNLAGSFAQICKLFINGHNSILA